MEFISSFFLSPRLVGRVVCYTRYIPWLRCQNQLKIIIIFFKVMINLAVILRPRTRSFHSGINLKEARDIGKCLVVLIVS